MLLPLRLTPAALMPTLVAMLVPIAVIALPIAQITLKATLQMRLRKQIAKQIKAKPAKQLRTNKLIQLLLLSPPITQLIQLTQVLQCKLMLLVIYLLLLLLMLLLLLLLILPLRQLLLLLWRVLLPLPLRLIPSQTATVRIKVKATKAVIAVLKPQIKILLIRFWMATISTIMSISMQKTAEIYSWIPNLPITLKALKITIAQTLKPPKTALTQTHRTFKTVNHRKIAANQATPNLAATKPLTPNLIKQQQQVQVHQVIAHHHLAIQALFPVHHPLQKTAIMCPRRQTKQIRPSLQPIHQATPNQTKPAIYKHNLLAPTKTLLIPPAHLLQTFPKIKAQHLNPPETTVTPVPEAPPHRTSAHPVRTAASNSQNSS